MMEVKMSATLLPLELSKIVTTGLDTETAARRNGALNLRLQVSDQETQTRFNLSKGQSNLG